MFQKPSAEERHGANATFRVMKQALAEPLGSEHLGDYESVDDFVSAAANWIVKAYHLPKDRVEKILRRTVCPPEGESWPRVRREDFDLAVKWRFDPSLAIALEWMPGEQALAFFESADLKKVVERESALLILGSVFVPAYTLEDLRSRVTHLIGLLKADREYILRTGFNRTLWNESQRFPSDNMQCLYFVKLPAAAKVSENPSSAGSMIYKRCWNPGDEWDDSAEASWTAGYERAPLLPFLSTEDAHRLENLRPKLLDLKIELLERLYKYLKCKKVDGLWDECLRPMVDSLLSDEVEFLLKMDKLYSGYDFRTEEHEKRARPLEPGGLTAMLELIGFVEKELKIGTFALTCRDLGSELYTKLCLNSNPDVSYFEAASMIGFDRLDSVLDRFVELESQETGFWDEYRARVNDALENEFYEEVEITVRQSVKRRVAEKFELHVRNYIDWVKQSCEFTGELPDIRISGTTGAGPRYVFKRMNGVWKIVFDGKQIMPNHRKGFDFILFLVQRPGQEFHVLQLAELVEKRSVVGVQKAAAGEIGELAEQGIHILGKTSQNEIADDDYKADVIKEWNEAHQEKETAELMGDQQLLAKADKRIRTLAPLYYEIFGSRGKSRGFLEAENRVQWRIAKAISMAVNSVKEHTSLYHHLKASLFPLGYTICYRPPQHIDWHF